MRASNRDPSWSLSCAGDCQRRSVAHRRVDGRSNFLITGQPLPEPINVALVLHGRVFFRLGDAKDTDQPCPGRCRQVPGAAVIGQYQGDPQGQQEKTWRLDSGNTVAPGNASRTAADSLDHGIATTCRPSAGLEIQRRETVPRFDLPAMKSDRYRAEHDVLRAYVVPGQQVLHMLSSRLADAQSEVARNLGELPTSARASRW